MNAQVSNRISVTTSPRFWDHFVASLLLIRYQRVFIVFHLVFPSFGIFLLMTPFLGYRLGPVEILLALPCLFFTPLIIAFAIWAAGRQTKLARGPITYVFDPEGMHATGASFTQTIQWSGILRVRRLKRFLFVFVGPARAVFIPLRDLSHLEDLEHLLAMAAEHIKSR
jgi:hypothetical protein